MHRLLLASVVVLLTIWPQRAAAQAERYELGLRLRAFEAAWDANAGLDGRKRALDPLQRAVSAFFTAQFGQAGSYLDQARHALVSAEPVSAGVKWAEGLAFQPEFRLADLTETELPFTVTVFYKADVKPPTDAQLRLYLSRDGKSIGAPYSTALGDLPFRGKMPLANLTEGDVVLRVAIEVGGKVVATTDHGLSLVADLRPRLARLQKTVESWPREPATTDVETVRGLLRLLDTLAQRRTLETNYPAARLLAELERAVAEIAAGRTFYGNKQAGQFWLTLAAGQATVPVRLMAPESVKQGKPLPLVLALHGAGGSENLFFDGYGRGAVVGLCQQRGWLLVAPRLTAVGRQPTFPEIIEAVASLYPVDRQRVFLVGHSLGAQLALVAAEQQPQAYAGLAALGGGRAVRQAERLKDLPIFIGIGNADFALRGARALAETLKKAGSTRLNYREYDDLEHLVIVQHALPDVFKFFDQAVAR